MTDQNQLPFLPAGWEWTTLGEISFVNPRWWDFELNDDDLITFVPMAAVEEETGHLDASTIRKWREVKQGYTRFQENDVLFAKITPSMENGKAAVAVNLWEGRGVGSTEFHVLRPTASILPKQILYFLLQKGFREAARRAMKGVAGQLRVPPEFVAQTGFPLPPLAEQQRIVDEIEKQFSRLDAAVGMLLRVERNLERLRAATLKAAIEGRLVPTEAELSRTAGRDYEPADVLLQRVLRERRARWEADQLTKMKERGKTPKDDKWKAKYKEPIAPNGDLSKLPEGWTWATWNQLSDWVTYGFTRPMPHVETGVPIVTAKNINNLTIDFIDTHKTTKEAFKELSEKDRPKRGDILITKDGAIGRSAVVETDKPFCINQSVAVIWLRDCEADKKYLLYVIETPHTQEPIKAKVRGVAIQHLSITDFARFTVPLPPLAEQPRIVAEVERRISVNEELQTLVSNALRRAVILRQKILRDAFAGKLVPQDSTDEAAGMLLERVRAEKAKREAEARQSRKERRGKMKGRKATTSERKPRRPLRDVVAESKRRLTPEQLFAEAGFTSEIVEEFFEELRREVKAGHIEQVRPDNAKVYLIASNA